MANRPPIDWGRTLSLVAHELRTPLSVVTGCTRTLLSEQAEPPLTDRQRRLVQQSIESCRRLSTLAGELGDLARLLPGSVELRRQPLPLWPLLEEAVRGVEATLNLDPRLELRGPRDLTLEAHPARLQAAFAALLTAVARESRPGTGIGVSLSRTKTRVRVTMAPAEGMLELERQRFGGLVSYRGLTGGVGLGVLLAVRVMELHGGGVKTSTGELRGGAVVVLPLPPGAAGRRTEPGRRTDR